MAASFATRKVEILYLIFFIIHIPVMFIVDLAPLYPDSVKPVFIGTVRQWYIDKYRDQFFIQPPAWFNLYMWMEALYHVPLSVWAVFAIWRDDPKVPLHLLIWSVQTAVTTATCVAEYLSWSTLSPQEKLSLGSLYVPYLVLAVFMGVDMYNKLDQQIGRRAKLE